MSGLSWKEHAAQMVWAPLIVQAGLVSVFFLIRVVALCSCTAIRRSVRKWSETSSRAESCRHRAKQMPRIFGTSVLDVMQIPCSISFVCIWVNWTYRQQVDFPSNVIQVILCVFFILHYILAAALKGFPWSYPWWPQSLIDVITVTCVCVRPRNLVAAPWIDWGYLRAIQAVFAYKNLTLHRGLFAYNSNHRSHNLFYAAGLFVLSLWAFVTVFAGTLLLSEVFGDPPWLENTSVIYTDAGALSFVTVIYWMGNTVTSVGYGDFLPTTVLSRACVGIACLLGVPLLALEAVGLEQVRQAVQTGLDEYRRPVRGVKHVVVTGGGVDRPHTMFKYFHKVFFTDHRVEQWSSCVILSQHDDDTVKREILKEMLQEALQRACALTERHTFVPPLIPPDLERVKIDSAHRVVIFPDRLADDWENEDTKSIHRALVFRETSPNIIINLALLNVASKVQASRCGLKAESCLAIEELRIGLLAQSCLCFGWSTLITNLLISPRTTDRHFEGPRRFLRGRETRTSSGSFPYEFHEWVDEYRHGAMQSIFGFRVAPALAQEKILFSELARRMLEQGSIPLAMQVDGEIVVNPMDTGLCPGDIIFAIAHSRNALRPFTDAQAWSESFLERRAAGAVSVPPRDEHVIAGRTHWSCRGGGDSAGVGESISVSSDELGDLRRTAKEIADEGGHILLVMFSRTGWEDIRAFNQLIRSPSSPCHVPFLVLASEAPPEPILRDVFQASKKTSFLIGNPDDVMDIVRAGAAAARAVLLLEGRHQKDIQFADSRGILALTALEHFLETHGGPDGVPTITELVNEESAVLLTDFPSFAWRSLPLGHVSDVVEEHVTPHTPLYRHPRYVAGQVFSMSCLGALMAGECHVPGVVELIRGLVLGRRADGERQQSEPWQVEANPTWAGKLYGDVVQELLAVPCRAVCLALVRRRFEGMSARCGRYVVTNPPSETEVRASDCFIVLAGGDFPALCQKSGLVLVASASPSADLATPNPVLAVTKADDVAIAAAA
eukprot:TRINITY_DN55052_c0_g1_i1.p1 TRINITY_DN55052_c0_g1~~TRINITY_DN55052_c0_g1_i1.p1  ORF type:complete len:1008 (+),score=132.38 TRINITY_DN55052_c0_g1_i1:14-3037(+)